MSSDPSEKNLGARQYTKRLKRIQATLEADNARKNALDARRRRNLEAQKKARRTRRLTQRGGSRRAASTYAQTYKKLQTELDAIWAEIESFDVRRSVLETERRELQTRRRIERAYAPGGPGAQAAADRFYTSAREQKRARGHEGIDPTTNLLRPGYRYTGERTKSGLPVIRKADKSTTRSPRKKSSSARKRPMLTTRRIKSLPSNWLR